jgi:putative phosphoesterase
MKIGIVSDTHGNCKYLENVVDWLIKKHKIGMLYHCGDDYDDVAGLGDRFIEIVQIPGIYDERYKNGSLPAKVFETVLGLNLLLVHSLEKDVNQNDLIRADIILSGHTHREEIKLSGGKLFVNPGHLKGELDKNMPPSFGLISLEERSVTAAIYNLKFNCIRSMELMRSESGLFKTS